MDPNKMLIYCPDWNGPETRNKDAFYQVQDSNIEIYRSHENNELVVMHSGLVLDVHHSAGQNWWEGYIWWELCGLYVWMLGNQGPAKALPKYEKDAWHGLAEERAVMPGQGPARALPKNEQ